MTPSPFYATPRMRASRLTIAVARTLCAAFVAANGLAVSAQVADAPTKVEDQRTSAAKGNVTEMKAMAEKGDQQAQSLLGLNYYMGTGVLQDYGEAHRWLRLAGNQGDVSAMVALANMYATGVGCLRNIEIAYALLNVALYLAPSLPDSGRRKLKNLLTMDQIMSAQALSHELKRPGHFLAALDEATSSQRSMKNAETVPVTVRKKLE